MLFKATDPVEEFNQLNSLLKWAAAKDEVVSWHRCALGIDLRGENSNDFTAANRSSMLTNHSQKSG